ncbi:hypothetical protein [Hymenobacter lapidiphilus]|uniref:hypothetical protein n=1 Tax=Hymenobacter sp. CCM 8763 TaxID=2303334 RepID=UPI001F5B06C6|nr:hypothetical protein [Hymenobacter sp. CCM 8763]
MRIAGVTTTVFERETSATERPQGGTPLAEPQEAARSHVHQRRGTIEQVPIGHDATIYIGPYL